MVGRVAESLSLGAERPAAGPLRAGSRARGGESTLFAVDPVFARAEMSRVRVVRVVADLNSDEIAGLNASFSHFFVDAPIEIVLGPDGGGFAQVAGPLDFDAPPTERLVGAELDADVLHGPDARRIRAWQGELELLLHEHPVNRRRLRTGADPVSMLWCWGAGRGMPEGSAILPWLYARDAGLRGLWRHYGGDDRIREPVAWPGASRAESAVVELCDPWLLDYAAAFCRQRISWWKSGTIRVVVPGDRVFSVRRRRGFVSGRLAQETAP